MAGSEYETPLTEGADPTRGLESYTRYLRMMSARVLRDAVVNLPEMSRRVAWVPSAISWIGRLDPGKNLPLMTRILDEKKFFFFKIWPRECREQAEIIVSDSALSVDEMDGS